MEEQIENKKIEIVKLGTIEATGPDDIISKASKIATQLARIIDDKKLFTVISRRKYVNVEGWNTLGAMMGILPREVEDSVIEHENGDYEATVELIRTSDGAVVGRASSICGMDEKTWANRPRYARRSMAITRATGKAFRLGFSWIIKLAGYEPTPAEEMPVIEATYKEIKPKSKPKAKSKPQAKSTAQEKNNIILEELGFEPDSVTKTVEDAGPEDIMTIERACKITNSEGTLYMDIDSDKLSKMTIGISKGLAKPDLTPEKKQEYLDKRQAIKILLQARADGSLSAS